MAPDIGSHCSWQHCAEADTIQVRPRLSVRFFLPFCHLHLSVTKGRLKSPTVRRDLYASSANLPGFASYDVREPRGMDAGDGDFEG